MSGNPRPAKSYTGGEKSSLPLNHGFTVCWSDETTSVRWPGMSERTWLASTCPASASSPAPLRPSRQLPIHVGIELQLQLAVRHVTPLSLGCVASPEAAGARATAAT